MTPGRRKRSYRRNPCFTEPWLLVEDWNTSELNFTGYVSRFSLDPKSSWVKQQLLVYLPHSHPSESHPLGRKWRPRWIVWKYSWTMGPVQSVIACGRNWFPQIHFPKQISLRCIPYPHLIFTSLYFFLWILRESCKFYGNLRVTPPPMPPLFLEEGGIGGIPSGSHETYLLWIPMVFVGVKTLVEAHRWCHGAELFKVSGCVKNRVIRRV